MSMPAILREYGQAFRGDWSSIDGRCVRDEMADLAAWLEGEYPGDTAARERLSICPNGHGHWDWYCDDDCGADQ